MAAASDLCDPSVSQHYKGHKDAITSVDFNPNGRQLASASLDGTIMVWNFKSPQARVFRFSGHSDGVTGVKFSPTGHLVASSSRDRSVRLWVPSIKGENTAFKAHSATVRSVDFSLDGEYLATASDDKSIKIWSVHRQKFQFSLNQHTNWVRAARFAPESNIIASCSDDKTTKIWDMRTKECVHTFYGNDYHMHDVKFHNTGSCLATGLSNGGIKIWDCRVNRLLQSYHSHDMCVNSLDFHPNGDVLISASSDCTVKIHDLKEGRLIYTLHGHQPHSATAVAFTRNGEQFASAGSDNQILIWDTNFTEACDQLSDVFSTEGSRKKSAKRKINPPTRQVESRQSSESGSVIPAYSRPNAREPLAQINESMLRKSTFQPIQNTPNISYSSIQHQPSLPDFSGNFSQNSHQHSASEVVHSSAIEPATSQPFIQKEKSEQNVARIDQQRPKEEDLRVMEKLEMITNQMDILTQTVAIIEQRLTNTEDKLNYLMTTHRNHGSSVFNGEE